MNQLAYVHVQCKVIAQESFRSKVTVATYRRTDRHRCCHWTTKQ